MVEKSWLRWTWLGVWLGLVMSLFVGCYREAIIPDFPMEVKMSPAEAPKSVKVSFYQRDASAIPDVVTGLMYALRENRRWSTLESPLHMRLFPTHRSLEEAIQLKLSWVRAWARYDSVWLQSPRTWKRKFFQWPLTELLTHELNHVAMFQLCCSRKNWEKRYIPLWFREGMASVTARQEYLRLSIERLRSFFATVHGKSVWRNLESVDALRFYQNELYSLGHWMFLDLQDRLKVEGVRKILLGMRGGLSFQKSFQKQVGMSVPAFLQDFERRNLRPDSVGMKPLEQKSPMFSNRPHFSTACSLHHASTQGKLRAVHLFP
ncbi:MAG: hypothetical protein H6727_07415 [Myxococcales bacterium]|nr:hypothetical protein [Myxococcales bacterium]